MKVAKLSNLKAARAVAGLTQRGLAEKAGLTHATICALENLKQGAEPGTIKALSKALGVKAEKLIGSGESYDKDKKPGSNLDRQRGRKKNDIKHLRQNVYIRPDQHEKFISLGGSEWLREQIDNALPKKRDSTSRKHSNIS
jgi:transcriptional regulator with XRE-family HTH domain